MGIWKEKVYPKIQKIFGKDGAKKAAAAEACKSFDDSKELVTKEFEEKQQELKPKVIDIYEASSKEIKTLIKELPKEPALKKHSTKVQKFLDELVKIDFPGSKTASEASSKYGPSLVSGPVTFVFEKVSTFIVVEEEVVSREAEVVPPPSTETAADEPPPPAASTETDTVAEEIVIAEEAVVEAVTEEPPKEEEKTEEPPKA